MAEIIKFPLNELNIDGYDLTDDEKDRIVLALQGKAVKNPVQEDIDLLRVSIAATLVNVPTYTGFDTSTQALITTKLNALSTALTNLETHTNIVSGVTINYTGFPPNFLGRLSIANSYNQTRESLRKREDGPCGVEEGKVEIYSRMFGSILGNAEQEVENIRSYLDDIDPATIQYAEMNSYITTAISNLNDFKTQDNQAFFEAYNFVNKISMAQALINSKTDDFSTHLFERVIGTRISNTDDISNLKVQCQVWGADTTTPPSDFSSNFSSNFALTSIASSLDVDFEGWTAGYVLKFNSSGTLYPAVDDRIILLGEIRAGIDGGGSAPTAASQESPVEATSDFTVVTLHGDVAGSITAAVKKFSGGSTIAMGTVGLNSSKTQRVTDLSSWNTTAIYAGDILIVDWTSGAVLTKANLTFGRKAL